MGVSNSTGYSRISRPFVATYLARQWLSESESESLLSLLLLSQELLLSEDSPRLLLLVERPRDTDRLRDAARRRDLERLSSPLVSLFPLALLSFSFFPVNVTARVQQRYTCEKTRYESMNTVRHDNKPSLFSM